MTFEDLKESDKDKIKNVNRRNRYGLSSKQLERLIKEHKKAMQLGDEYTCLLIEYRLCDINFHTEVDLLHAGEYEKVIEIIKTW
ncbi:hypothetical protein [Barnesiella intestinihominis]|jgi:hypothetical protein|uniref:hypothetical protein n=1 Tax=Barnesiella intestinihominis TaxID=487174 RepID=UPI003FF135E2